MRTFVPRRAVEPRLEHVGAVGHLGDEHARRDLLPLHVELADERGDQLVARELLDAVDDPPLAPEHPAAPDEEHLERGLEIVLGHPDDVEVLGRREHHLLALERPAGRLQLVADLRRLLVLLTLRGLRHLALEALEHRAGVARQELGQGVDVGPVPLLGDARRLGHARARAPADVEVEAGPPGARPLVEERVRARPHGEDAGEGIERVADRPGVPVGTEVSDLLALRAAEHLRPRPPLPHRQGEVRIGLVVAVADVEPRPVLLDQVVLEHQRVDLARGHDPLDARGRRHHRLGAGVQGPAPVVREALAERAGLPDVDHAAVGVAEQVGAGGVGDRGGGRPGDAHPVILGGGR